MKNNTEFTKNAIDFCDGVIDGSMIGLGVTTPLLLICLLSQYIFSMNDSYLNKIDFIGNVFISCLVIAGVTKQLLTDD